MVCRIRFLSASKLVDPSRLVCLKIHGLYFTKPVQSGQIIEFTSKVVYAGKSSLISYIQVENEDQTEPFVSGFISFIYVDENTKSTPHNIEINPKLEEDIILYEKAKELKK